jgi:alkylated DNA repair dioxygenase AlkB
LGRKTSVHGFASDPDGTDDRRQQSDKTVERNMAIRRVSSVVPRPLAGLRLVPGYLDRAAQERLRDDLTAVMRRAPVYTPRMPKTGHPMSVRMSNCGPLGWVTDEHGYRYQPHHPETGEPWPPIPEILLAAWRELADYPHPPEACLW